MTLDDLIARIKRDLQENRASRHRHDGARQHIHPATWAHQAATVYEFVNMEALGLQHPFGLIARLCEPPTLIVVDPANLVTYMGLISSLAVPIPPACGICTFDDVFVKHAPTLPGLMIVENANAFLDYIHKCKKTVEDFYQWSVGFYPLPNQHTHLILQPH